MSSDRAIDIVSADAMNDTSVRAAASAPAATAAPAAAAAAAGAAPLALPPTRPLRAPQPSEQQQLLQQQMQQQTQQPQQLQPRRVLSSPGGAVRVLVVDDEPTICKALTIALIREGYEVLSANGGEAAHALLAAERFDVLIVDLRMPDLRGDVVYHLASAIQPWLARRTVFTTGDISERAEQIVRACDCPLLRKPFSLAEALGAVRAVAPSEGATRTA